MTISAVPHALWELNNNLTDATGNSHSGTGTGIAYNASGLLGQCIDAGSFVAAANNALGTITGGRSFGFWCKYNGGAGGAGSGSVAVWGNYASQVDFTILSVNMSDEEGFVEVQGQGANNSVQLLIPSHTISAPPDSNWHLAVLTFASGVGKLYWDGTEVSSAAYNPRDLSGLVNPQARVATGSGFLDQPFIAPFYSAADITYLYNSGTGRAYADWEIAAPAAVSTTTYDRTILLRR